MFNVSMMIQTTVLCRWSNDNAHTLTAARAPPLYKSASHTSCSREWKYTSHTAQQHNSRAKQGPYQPQPTRRPGVTQAGTMGMAVATLSRHALLLFSNVQTSSKGRTSGGVEKTIFSFGRTWAEGWCGCLNVLEKDGFSQTWEKCFAIIWWTFCDRWTEDNLSEPCFWHLIEHLNISYQMGGHSLCALAGWKVERFCCDDLLLQCLLNIWTIMEVETFLPGFTVSHVNIFI